MDYPKSVPNVGLVNGKFVDEDAATGVVGSLIPSAWGNAVSDEIINVIKAAQILPDEANKSQLIDAIRTVVGALVGGARGVKMALSVAAAIGNLTADEVVVKTGLGGQAWLLANFNKTLNIATVGVNGMDTGAAPVSGFVAIYAIYNPATGASGLLGVNGTAVKVGEVYGGGSMPAGYTASALVSIVPTNSAGQLVVLSQIDRSINFAPIVVLSASSNTAGPTAYAISQAVPKNARTVSGLLNVISSVSGSITLSLSANASNSGMVDYTANVLQRIATFTDIPLTTPQTVFYQMAATGTPTSVMTINKYTF